MDKFVTRTKPSLTFVRGTDKDQKDFTQWQQRMRQTKKCVIIFVAWTTLTWIKQNCSPSLSSVALTKHLLNTLQDKSNPITHSDIALRTGGYARVLRGYLFSCTRMYRIYHVYVYRPPKIRRPKTSRERVPRRPQEEVGWSAVSKCQVDGEGSNRTTRRVSSSNLGPCSGIYWWLLG